MLFDDYVMRQIQKIAELALAIAARRSGQGDDDVEAQLAEAYRSLVGMEREMADRMSADSLARLLGEPRQVQALATLMMAHGDLCRARERPSEALRLWERALGLLDCVAGLAAAADEPALRRALLERIAES